MGEETDTGAGLVVLPEMISLDGRGNVEIELSKHRWSNSALEPLRRLSIQDHRIIASEFQA